MLKIIGYVFLGLVVVLAIGATVIVSKFNNRYFKERPNQLAYSYDSKTIQFEWAERQYEAYFEPHVAMVIPVTIDGVPRKFSFQFDTGAPNSLIYEQPLESLITYGLTVKAEGKAGARIAKNIQLIMGGNKIEVSSMHIKENYGKPIDWQDTTSAIALGTIGSDFIDDKVTVIDFKNQIIRIYEERPKWMSSLSGFEPFSFQGRRIMLPVKIGGRKRKLLYDSGCSSFGLLTSKKRFKRYTDAKEKEVGNEGNRWGEALPIHHKTSQTIMKAGGAELPLRRISYVDLYANWQHFMTPFTRIGGWLGNKPFIEGTMILDTQKEEFLVVEGGVKSAEEAP